MDSPADHPAGPPWWNDPTAHPTGYARFTTPFEGTVSYGLDAFQRTVPLCPTPVCPHCGARADLSYPLHRAGCDYWLRARTPVTWPDAFTGYHPQILPEVQIVADALLDVAMLPGRAIMAFVRWAAEHTPPPD